MLAFVAATTAPAVSHAANHEAVNTHSTKATEAHDCHGESATKAEAPKDTHHNTAKDCCDKGMCKCAGGNCHSALKIFGGHHSAALNAAAKNARALSFYDPLADPVQPDRLKRPPRA